MHGIQPNDFKNNKFILNNVIQDKYKKYKNAQPHNALSSLRNDSHNLQWIVTIITTTSLLR